jgi:monovalent cation/hydrogen antiporter
LIGLQLPSVVNGLQGYSTSIVVWASVAVLVTVVVVRIAWVFPFTYVPRWLSPRIRAREPEISARAVFVVSWAGMRGVVSLAAAFAIPLTVNSGEDFPGRSLILFLTFVVVVGTLLLHGLTLPWVIRVLGVQGDEEQSDARAEAAAQDKAARAAAARLDELVGADADDVPQVRNRAADILRSWNTHRANSAWERLGRSDEDLGESPSNAFRSLRLEMIDAERGVFIAERDAGRIDDEVLRKVLRELDLEEATLDRD